MSSFTCPRCATILDDQRLDGLRLYGCPSCMGHALNLSQIRERMPQEGFRAMWQAARAAEASGPGCPVCQRAMRVIRAGRESVEIDVCVGCQMLWLDAGEQEKLGLGAPQSPAPAATAPPTAAQQSAHQAAAVLLAQEKVAADAERYRRQRTVERRTWWVGELLDVLMWWSV